MLLICFQHKTFVNIDINGSNVLLSDLNCRKVVVYISNRCIANLSLVLLNILV